jgi:hypothetical protein
VQARGVEPVDPFQRRQLDIGERLPWAFAVDLLGLEESDRRLGECVVQRVADATDGGINAGIQQPPREGEAGV